MKILYVEDEPNHAQLIRLYAQSYQHTLFLANTLEQAFTLLQETPELILVDVLLRETRSGLEFIRSVRASGSKVPIVVITALSSVLDQEACRQAGADAIIFKPITMKNLDNIFEHYS